MKIFIILLAIITTLPIHAEIMQIDLKLAEVNHDSTQARFYKGVPAYGVAKAFATVTCWGSDGNTFNLEIERSGQEINAQFSSIDECKSLIKKAKGFLGISYETIRFVVDSKSNKLISFEKI